MIALSVTVALAPRNIGAILMSLAPAERVGVPRAEVRERSRGQLLVANLRGRANGAGTVDGRRGIRTAV